MNRNVRTGSIPVPSTKNTDMKKLALISILFVLSSALSYSQDFKYEVFGGVSLPYITYPSSFSYEQTKGTSEMILTGHLGIRAFFPIDVNLKDDMFYAAMGLAFSGKGYKCSSVYRYYKGIEARAWSIDFPFRLGYKFKINNDFALKAELGLFGACGLFGKWKDSQDKRNSGQYYDTDNRDTFGCNRVDVGLSGYIGAEFNRITAGIGYNHGLPSMGALPYHAKSRNILISVGYLF